MKLLEPESLSEALEPWGARGGREGHRGRHRAQPLIRQRLVRPETLVSLRRAPGLDRLELDEQARCIRLGPLVTTPRSSGNAALRERLPLVPDVFSRVGNVRVAAWPRSAGCSRRPTTPRSARRAARARRVGALCQRRGRARRGSRRFLPRLLRYGRAGERADQGGRDPAPACRHRGRLHEVRHPFLRGPAVRRRDRAAAAARGRTLRGSARGRRRRDGAPPGAAEAEAAARQAVTDELAREVGEAYARDARTLSDGRGSASYRRDMIRVWVRRTIELARDQARAAWASTNDAHERPRAGAGSSPARERTRARRPRERAPHAARGAPVSSISPSPGGAASACAAPVPSCSTVSRPSSCLLLAPLAAGREITTIRGARRGGRQPRSRPAGVRRPQRVPVLLPYPRLRPRGQGAARAAEPHRGRGRESSFPATSAAAAATGRSWPRSWRSRDRRKRRGIGNHNERKEASVAVDLVVKNGTVVTSTGRFRGGIAIDGGVIVAVAGDEGLPSAERTIDATGLSRPAGRDQPPRPLPRAGPRVQGGLHDRLDGRSHGRDHHGRRHAEHEAAHGRPRRRRCSSAG